MSEVRKGTCHATGGIGFRFSRAVSVDTFSSLSVLSSRLRFYGLSVSTLFIHYPWP